MLVLILLICAMVCFILGALPKVSVPVNLVPLGLAFFIASLLAGGSALR